MIVLPRSCTLFVPVGANDTPKLFYACGLELLIYAAVIYQTKRNENHLTRSTWLKTHEPLAWLAAFP